MVIVFVAVPATAAIGILLHAGLWWSYLRGER